MAYFNKRSTEINTGVIIQKVYKKQLRNITNQKRCDEFDKFASPMVFALKSPFPVPEKTVNQPNDKTGYI